MKKLALALGLLMTASAQAAPDNSADNESSTIDPTRSKYFSFEMLGVRPTLGTLSYTNALNDVATRFSAGISSDLNLASAFDISPNRWFTGLQTGVAFSHLGNANANAIGNGGTNIGNGGANFAVIPANVKLGYALSESVRVGIHGGGNAMFRSVPQEIAMTDSSAKWIMQPNVGLDLDVSFSRNVALALRPDWTFGTRNGLLAVNLAMGFMLD